MLDTVAMILYDRDVRACAGKLLGAVERSLVGHEEKGYWDEISRRL